VGPPDSLALAHLVRQDKLAPLGGPPGFCTLADE
jgi:hypothetical protein